MPAAADPPAATTPASDDAVARELRPRRTLLPAAGRRPGAAAAGIADAPLLSTASYASRRPDARCRTSPATRATSASRWAAPGAGGGSRSTASCRSQRHDHRRDVGAEHAAAMQDHAPDGGVARRSTLGRDLDRAGRRGGEAFIAGLALRGRLATHTTRFDFHLADGSLATFAVPYYFHIEPTLVVGGALGPFTYVMNQGAIALIGPDGNFDEQHITVPSIYFWDAHYAIGVRALVVPGRVRRAGDDDPAQPRRTHRGPGRHQVQRHPRGVGRAGVAVPRGRASAST